MVTYDDHLDALGLEGLGGGLGGVAGDAADLEFGGELGVVEDGADDGAALVASGTENRDDLGHDEG